MDGIFPSNPVASLAVRPMKAESWIRFSGKCGAMRAKNFTTL
jgi:hypothetical protein